MPFINGFPTEEDKKIALFACEHEQISDLVFVPTAIKNYANYQLITNDNIPINKEQEDIQKINFPFSNYACLFQRYTPYQGTYANEYSTKLYNFLIDYSPTFLATNTDFLSIPLPPSGDIKKKSYSIGNKLQITLPNNNLKINLSYYYPEINSYPFDLVFKNGTYVKLDLSQGGEWRTINKRSNTYAIDRDQAFEFPRIQNDCYESPVCRKWLLRFEQHYCQGQTIEIDEDILISSLIIMFNNLSQIDIDYIKNQIPECYFYDYLDIFFNEIDELILSSNSNIKKAKIPTKLKFNLSFDYLINHWQHSEEIITEGAPYWYNNFYINQERFLNYQFHPDNIYHIEAKNPSAFLAEKQNYIDLPDNLKFGGLLYGNNNYWQNYDYNLADLGNYIEAVTPLYGWNYNQKLKLKLSALGIDKYNSNNFIFQRVFDGNIPQSSKEFDTFYLDSRFTQNPTNPNNTLPEQDRYSPNLAAIILNKNIWAQFYNFFDNYYLRLLYESIEKIPNLTFFVGNKIYLDIEPVNQIIDNLSGYFWRGETKKVFIKGVQIINNRLSFVENKLNYNTSNKYFVQNTTKEELVIGEADATFTKYGQIHPIGQRFLGHIVNNFPVYKKSLYYSGIEANAEAIAVKGYNYPSQTYHSGTKYLKNWITSINIFSNINLPFTVLDKPIAFKTTGKFETSHYVDLNPSNDIKILRTYATNSYIHQKLQEALENCYMSACDLTEITKLIQEIHLSLDAGKYAYKEGTEDVHRDWNLGQQIEAQSAVLGLSFNSDYSIRSIRQGELIEQEDTIPAGWNFGQFGKNTGGSPVGQQGGTPEERRFGIAYEVRSNTFTNNDFTGETNQIKQGGIVLCENLPQLLHFVIQDLDRAFGLQDMGANILPTPNGEIANYQGLNQIILDVDYMLGQLSRQISSINILSLKNQAINQELLSVFGLPIAVKELEITSNSGVSGILPFPGFAPNSPTLSDLFGASFINLGALIGSKIEIKEESETEE